MPQFCQWAGSRRDVFDSLLQFVTGPLRHYHPRTVGGPDQIHPAGGGRLRPTDGSIASSLVTTTLNGHALGALATGGVSRHHEERRLSAVRGEAAPGIWCAPPFGAVSLCFSVPSGVSVTNSPFAGKQ
jgi:hypothetical protein